MKNSNVYLRAEQMVLHSKYNYQASDAFVKDLTRFLNTYGTFDSILMSFVDNGETLVLTLSVKNFNNTLTVKV